MFRKDRKIDEFTIRAKKEGYPARSVYKLAEINNKYRVIKKGYNVLDLGCAPGSWLIFISEKIGNRGKVIGVDIEDINIPLKRNIFFIKKNVMDLTGDEFNGQKFDAVVADLAPKTVGIRLIDSGKSLELSEKAFELAQKFLIFGGNFVCKVFEGEGSSDFFKEVSKKFKFAKRFRPRAITKESKEQYIIGISYHI